MGSVTPNQEFFEMYDSLVLMDAQLPSSSGLPQDLNELRDFINQPELFENLELHDQAQNLEKAGELK